MSCLIQTRSGESPPLPWHPWEWDKSICDLEWIWCWFAWGKLLVPYCCRSALIDLETIYLLIAAFTGDLCPMTSVRKLGSSSRLWINFYAKVLFFLWTPSMVLRSFHASNLNFYQQCSSHGSRNAKSLSTTSIVLSLSEVCEWLMGYFSRKMNSRPESDYGTYLVWSRCLQGFCYDYH